jgi:hypothetical protein
MSRNGLIGSAELGFQGADKSQLAKAESRLLIAWHSPNALLKTGLRTRPPEKAGTVTPFSGEQCVFSSPVCRANIAKNGHVSRISGQGAAEFLCTSDCVAEREGFELSVQFLEPCKGPHVRDLYGVLHQQLASGELDQEPGWKLFGTPQQL